MSDHDIEIVKQYFKQDQFARENGIELVSIERGKATARMQITEKHYNAFALLMVEPFFHWLILHLPLRQIRMGWFHCRSV